MFATGADVVKSASRATTGWAGRSAMRGVLGPAAITNRTGRYQRILSTADTDVGLA